MSTIDKALRTIKTKDKFSIEIKNKILDTHLLSNNENAKIPPAAEITSQHNYDLSSSSSSTISHSTNNSNNSNLTNINTHLQVELALNKNFKIKNSEFQQNILDKSYKKNDYFPSKIITKVRKPTNNEKSNYVIDKPIVINNELNNKIHVIPPKDSSSTNIKNELNEVYINKIKYKNTKLNTLSTFTTDDKNRKSMVEDLINASSFTQNSQSYINKRNQKKSHEENISSSSREEYNDKYRDLTPYLLIQCSEGESDFDFSESLITSKKRKRYKSIFDIYYETKKRNLKHFPSSNHKEHKHHKDDSLSHNMLSKERHNDKDNKKTLSDQSLVNKKIRSNSNDSSSRYYYSFDEDKERTQNKVEDSKTDIYKSNKKLKTKKSKILNKYENDLSYYYYRRQPPRSCRTKNEQLSAKIYYSMYSSEDNISEIEELFADLDNCQNNLENKINDSNNDDNNNGKEYMYSSDSKLRIKKKINKSNKTRKNLKYKNSLASLHSISEETYSPEIKEASTSVTPNRNIKKSKIINNNSLEKEDGDNKLSHNHYRYSSLSSSFSQRDLDQNTIRVTRDKDSDIDNNIEEKEKISKEILMSKHHHKLKNQRFLDHISNIKSDQAKNILKIKSLKSSYHHFSDNDNINNKYYPLNEEEEDGDDDDSESEYNYDELESNSEYTSGITTPSQRKKSLLLLDSKKLHDNLISTPTQIKMKSKKYSIHHRRTTTTTTDDSSLLYDDIDSNTEIDSSIEGKGRIHHYKRKSLEKINENVFDISNEAKNDDQIFDFNLLKTNGGKKKMDTPKKQKSNSINSKRNHCVTSSGHYHQLSSSSCSTPSSQNKNFISKNDYYDSEVLSYNKDPLDTHIFKSLSCTFDNNTRKLSKFQLMAQTNKRNKNNYKLSIPKKKIEEKMLNLEEKKLHHSYHHYDLFGKKLKSKINSSENFLKADSKKYKSKYKSKNEQKEKDQEILFMDMEEKKEEGEEEEEEGNDEEYSNLESFEDEDMIEEDSEREKNKNKYKYKYKFKNKYKYKNKNKNQGINRKNNLEDESDLMDRISVYESEYTCTPSKSLKRRKIKSINQEHRFKTMNPWNRNTFFKIGPIQNPTLLKRSQSSSNSNETIFDINANSNDNRNCNGTNNSNTNDATDMKKSQDQMKLSNFLEHKIIIREVIEQLNSLTVTEDEYDITPALNRHSNIYIKNELFNLLNDMTTREGSDSNVDNYTTIFSNSKIDKVEILTSRVVEKNKNDNKNDTETSKNKEEEFAIHYLLEDSTSSLSFMDDHEDYFIQNLEDKSKIDDDISILNDTKVTTNNTYLPTPMDSTMEDLSNSTPINPCIPTKIKSIISSTTSFIEDSISDDKIPINTLPSESIIDNIHPGFEIQQSSLKEELFNKIKQAKKLRDFSIESIYKSYQTNLRLINNTFIVLMDKKKINLYSLPSKKSILEAAKVLATFSTPVVFNENKNIGTGNHHHNSVNKREYNSSSLPIFPISSASTSTSSIPTTYGHTHSNRTREHYHSHSKSNIFQNKKKRIPINSIKCNGLNSQELSHDLSLLKLLN
ncbi:hypothetical protein H8356DRAFT_991109 [Neocallimastix lanati (nom. inval.)]|nr:hypothetical protein H8356DRAFT_991109 [Neocallimastix sp. JGI-2020a]